MKSHARRVIPSSVQQVWEAASNHQGMATWAPGLRVTLDELGSPEPNGVGAVRRISAAGPLPDIVERVTNFTPEKSISYEALAGVPFKNYGGEIRLSASGAATRIDYSLRAERRIPFIEAALLRLIVQMLASALARAARRPA